MLLLPNIVDRLSVLKPEQQDKLLHFLLDVLQDDGIGLILWKRRYAVPSENAGNPVLSQALRRPDQAGVS